MKRKSEDGSWIYFVNVKITGFADGLGCVCVCVKKKKRVKDD